MPGSAQEHQEHREHIMHFLLMYVPALLGGCNTSRPTITDIVLSEHIVHLRTVPSTMLARFDHRKQLHTRYLIRAFEQAQVDARSQ